MNCSMSLYLRKGKTVRFPVFEITRKRTHIEKKSGEEKMGELQVLQKEA